MPEQKPHEAKPEPIIVTPPPAVATASAGSPTVWTAENLAPAWFRDALNEARSGGDWQSIRREIVFAACFGESYIFEWTRRNVSIEQMVIYFPPDRHWNLVKKWKEIPKPFTQPARLQPYPTLISETWDNSSAAAMASCTLQLADPQRMSSPRTQSPFLRGQS